MRESITGGVIIGFGTAGLILLLLAILGLGAGCQPAPGGVEVQQFCESRQGQEECFLPAGRCGYYNWSDSLDQKKSDTLTFCVDMGGRCAGLCEDGKGNQ